jgi:tetratricopeptide (TPR) repeat protein
LARAYPDFYYESPHNLFLDALTAQGVLGAAILTAWIGLGLWAGRGRAGYSPYLTAALVATVVAHFFTVFILATGLCFYVMVTMLVGMDSKAVEPRRRWILAPVSAAMIFLALRMLGADRSLELARRDIAAGRTMDAVEHYDVARERGLSADLWFARSLAGRPFQQSLDAARRATMGEDAQNACYTVAWLYARGGDVHRTEQSLRISIACSPNWFKPHWILAQILRREGRLDEARAEAQRAAYLNAGKNAEVAAEVSAR